MAKTPFFKLQIPAPVEEYATTFSDMQNDIDRAKWVGRGCTTEFPHNPGALEEKLDEEQHRKIEKGPGY